MGIRTDKSLQKRLIFFSIALMLVALFTSRALLSISLVLFLFFTCLHQNILQQLKSFTTNPFLLGMSLLFFIPLLTGLWSDDKQEWWRWVRIKIPLFLLPFAFAGNWQLSKKQWRWIGYCFIGLVFVACCWSLWQYAINLYNINNSYLQAKSIPTTLENDHIRFSFLVCLAVITTVFLVRKKTGNGIQIALGVAVLFFIVFLHILSARTGLFSLYIFLGLSFIYLILLVRKIKLITGVFIIALLLPLAAWFLLPTFQNRIRYILYDFSFIKKDAYLPGSNDGSRMLSLKAGWNILKENPFGVGGGDVKNKTYEWYADHVPQMLETDKIYPSSEWLMYGTSAGWPGVIFFTAIMLLPFFEKIGVEKFFWLSLNSIAAFSLLFDIGLEVQFGVFIYAFIILWWWKWLRKESNAAITQ